MEGYPIVYEVQYHTTDYYYPDEHIGYSWTIAGAEAIIARDMAEREFMVRAQYTIEPIEVE